jgi:hypothetical protein
VPAWLMARSRDADNITLNELPNIVAAFLFIRLMILS